MIGRRSFLIGIAAGIAAPAIVRPASIMRVNALLVPNILTFSFPHPKPGQILTIHNVTKELFRVTGWGDDIDFLPGDVGRLVYLGDGKRSLVIKNGIVQEREGGGALMSSRATLMSARAA